MKTIYRGEDTLFNYRVKDELIQQKETWTLASTTAGTVTLEVDGKLLFVDFNADIATTLDDFLDKYSEELLNDRIVLTNTATAVIFLALDPTHTMTIKNISGGTSGTWTQNVNAGFVDLVTTEGIIVQLIDSADQILNKYSTNAIVGYDDITIDSSVDGAFSLKLQSAESLVARIGNLRSETKLQFANVTYDSSTIHEVNINKVIANIQDTKTTVITDLS